MDFIRERVTSLVSKKLAGTGVGVAALDSQLFAQAIVIAAYLLAQAYTDATKTKLA